MQERPGIKRLTGTRGKQIPNRAGIIAFCQSQDSEVFVRLGCVRIDAYGRKKRDLCRCVVARSEAAETQIVPDGRYLAFVKSDIEHGRDLFLASADGSGRARQYLWLAVGRLLQKDRVVRAWYESKVKRDGGKKRRAMVGLVRKLAKAVYWVARGEAFDSRKLFDVARLNLT